MKKDLFYIVECFCGEKSEIGCLHLLTDVDMTCRLLKIFTGISFDINDLIAHKLTTNFSEPFVRENRETGCKIEVRVHEYEFEI